MRRNANRAEYEHNDDAPKPGDEQHGTWPRAQLERMNARFVERVERAIKRGREHPADGAERK